VAPPDRHADQTEPNLSSAAEEEEEEEVSDKDSPKALAKSNKKNKKKQRHTDLLYRRSYQRRQERPCGVQFLEALAWVLVFSFGVFFAFAPSESITRLLGNTKTAGYIWLRLLGWIAILFSLWGLNCTFGWCRRHRPVSRWDTLNTKSKTYRTHRELPQDKNNKKKKESGTGSCNPRPRVFVRDPCGGDIGAAWDGSSSLFEGTWDSDTAEISSHRRSFCRTVFRIDLMQVLWVVILLLIVTWEDLVIHSSRPDRFLPAPYYFDCLFLGALVFYFLFRVFMALHWRFIWNVALVSLLVVVLCHVRCLFQPGHSFWSTAGWTLVHGVLLFITAVVVAAIISIRKLYEL
jgi:hypothetical protein